MPSSKPTSPSDPPSPLQDERHALPPSVEAKRASSSSSPSNTHRPHHLSPPAQALHHRSGVDELLVGPSNTSLASQPYHDAASFLGTCIEIELAEGEDVPLFRRPDFRGGGQGHGTVERIEEVPGVGDGEGEKQQGKRKASQRMSTTFESVVGFGRTMKRRVSSLWSNRGGDGDRKRKDSRWMSLEGGQWREQAEERRDRPPVLGAAGPAAARQENNPYPSRSWFLDARAAAAAQSSRTSGHWTPCTVDARSTAGLLGVEGDSLSRSMTNESFRTARTRLLEREEGAVLQGEDAGVDGIGDLQTPKEAKPRGESLVETGYTLAHHVEHAKKLGRFDPERIARRFDGEEGGTVLEPAVASPPAVEESLQGRPDQHNHSKEEPISSNKRKNSTMWSFFRGRQASQPREPRPSVATVEQEEERSRVTFGADLARVAGIIGTSMQQAPVML
ncbi:hypothetical protein M409DRAFT_61095 [Zasmidium cellare ATCC 36951]|uniref:Uncharacterized protein n=1 Tax=Zasmidium cellare ATCC 36951 TaxID=1080233 RepID=A0A6A6BX33_ZASCE|nr:uncharacterized protein M409DRAFT_61095 [Zasmidium cellare ATCC 36951]KAF2159143.1 hypothetical protein M409DRAFT_61095 [Zasmidium cellare ATCC 36951]